MMRLGRWWRDIKMQLRRPICKKRIGLLVCLLVLLFGLWSMALVVTYQDHQRIKYEESIVHPGAVTYGTHSIALIPMVSTSPRRSKIPMISGGSVRAYAHSGHAEMPSTQSSQPVIHTLSSATIKTVGSGAGTAIAAASPVTSSRGIRYTNSSVAMPALAWNSTSVIAEQAAASPNTSPRIRKAKPSVSGDDGDWQNGGEGDWWYFDEDHWRAPDLGETRYDETLGYVVVWNGSAWVKVTEYDPLVPVGEVPWLYILFLCTIICVIKKKVVPLRTK